MLLNIQKFLKCVLIVLIALAIGFRNVSVMPVACEMWYQTRAVYSEILVSVIMPVYNGEKYLKESVESVLNSTLNDKLELICVNDGSKDNSLEILEEYLKKDSRLVILNQENQGEAVARQNGLNLAKGEYVAFIDQDDKIEPNAYEIAYNYMREYDADIICFGWRNFSDDGSKIVRNDCLFDELKIYDDWWEAKKHRGSIYLWNKLYKRSLIVDNDVRFDPNLRITDDEGFNLCAYSQAKKIIHIPYVFYNYRQNTSSLMFTTSLVKLIKSYIEMWKYVKYYYKQHNINISYFKMLGYFLSVYKDEMLSLIRTLFN